LRQLRRGFECEGGDQVTALLSERNMGYVFVALSAAGFGLLSVLIKLSYSFGAEPMTLLAARFMVAVAAIWILALIVDRHALRIGRKDLAYIALIGPFGVGYSSILYFYSLQLVDASLFAALLYTYPSMVNVAAAIWLRERLTPRRILALAITFLGVLFVTGLEQLGSMQVSLPGVLLGLGASATYAIYTLGIQRQTRRHPPLVVNTYVLTFGTLVVLLVRPPFAWQGSLDWPVLALVGTMAIFCTIVPIFLYLTGIRRIGAGRAAIVSNLEPIVTIMLAMTILAERLAPLQFLGVGAVLAGVVLSEGD
jgi:drug/metabolite transporter (DMT)-like permease